MNRAALTEPFPQALILQREGQHGKTLSYVATHAVIERLNDATDGWDFTIERYEILDSEVVVLGKLVVEGILTKAAFGGAGITRNREGLPHSLADDLKAAASDALKKCASLCGVGLEIYAGQKNNGAGSKPALTAVPSVPDRLSQKQLAALQATTRRQNIDRTRVANILSERFGKRDLTTLTRSEASTLLTELNGRAANG